MAAGVSVCSGVVCPVAVVAEKGRAQRYLGGGVGGRMLLSACGVGRIAVRSSCRVSKVCARGNRGK